MLLTPVRTHGVLQLYKGTRKMEVYDFVLTFVNWMLEPRKTPTHFPTWEAIESLVSAGYFSCLDLKAGFQQIAMDEVLKQYTAFTMGNLRFFECKCMSFGLCNAPATFQKLMQNCLGEVNLTNCFIYSGNMIVFSKMEEEHLQHLQIVFNHFREHNLKLKLTKCEFFQNEINYLAHHISKEGVQPSKMNLKTVAELAPPQTYTEIQAFLGLVGHYWRFFKGFACIAQPFAWTSIWGGCQ